MEPHEPDTQGRASLNVWSVQGQGQSWKQYRTEHKGHTPTSIIKINISDPAGIRTRSPGWKAGILPTTPRRRTKNIQYILQIK